MGYSARYHATSLIAVFLALAVGILIGAEFGGDALTETRKNLEQSLVGNLQDARSRADDLSGELGRAHEFDEKVYPVLTRERLLGKRIAVVAMGGLPSEITAAYLWAQFEEAERITRERRTIWQRYHGMLAGLESQGLLRRPVVPANCQHNGHLYYVLLPEGTDRDGVLRELKANGVHAVFHYVPLHSSPAGRRFGRSSGDLGLTTSLSERLIRLPIWIGLGETQQQRVCDLLGAILRR